MSIENDVSDYKIRNEESDVFILKDSCTSTYIHDNYDIRWMHYMHSYSRNNSAKTVLSNSQKFMIFIILFLIYSFFKSDYFKCTLVLFHVLDILFVYKALTLCFVTKSTAKFTDDKDKKY